MVSAPPDHGYRKTPNIPREAQRAHLLAASLT
jgi:hypothetical protein